ncbi:MAG: lipoyl(octanoyl) transferase LipB [Solirubrobacteraceae bacterium]|jgi:lipoyl(octanoyl) transferase|nr:lipoyl(octanoyl) transferase LipB [Solirubrobacteraceae bacterium]
MADAPDLWVVHLPRPVAYRDGLALQERVRAAREAQAVPDVLLVLEHEPVYTRGRRSDPAELPLGEAWYAARGIGIEDVDRGGKVTYHAPGQVVAYPIVRTADVVAHVRALERAMIAALAEEGVAARARTDEGPDFTGVWVQDRKIGSIGVHVRRGITTHGLALNVDMDLEPWTWIVPCGLDVPMTSLAAETGRSGPLVPCLRRRVAYAYARETGRRQRLVSPARLERMIALVSVP